MRILLVQRSLNPPGGGNAVAAWMVHALADRHELGVLTAAPWTPDQVNAFYGTTIPAGRVRTHVVPRPWSWLTKLPEQRLNRIRMCSVLHYAIPLADQYDLLITADDYGPFVRPGLQYLHYPAPLHPRPARLAPIVQVYFAFCDRLAGVPWDRARANATIANSQWTKAALARLIGIHAEHVLYPPVLVPEPGLPWEERSNTFLCVGRFHGSKYIEVAMAIVRRIRAQAMPDARLVIVGSAVDPDYTRRLYRFAARDRDWIDFREDLARAELNGLMGRSRYGLQAMVDEHFGMATAEMARAGCVVFAHDSGGTIEVLNGDRRVLWRTEDEAVARISALVRDAVARDEVRWRLTRHAATFGTERFGEQVLHIVEGFQTLRLWPGQVSERNSGSRISSSYLPIPATRPSRR